MISVDEALAYILQHFHPLEPEQVPMLEALDRVLAQDIVSDVNVPPFVNSAMDGFAVRAEDVAGATPDRPVTLQVTGDVAAGHLAQGRVERGAAIRIMTGAPLPPGADSVVRFEETSQGVANRHVDNARGGRGSSGTGAAGGPGAAEPGSPAVVGIVKPVKRGENVRAAGEDMHAGETILHKGSVVRPAEIGVLASLGRKEVQVHRRPRVAILATGDELVTIDEPVSPGKIRNSNEYS
ncbi:MAG: molybdopterin molybdotransferase MoeA, partial [Chloroflexi bacterium]|nr:molybdopterin molybdotransferase MoeA [Chloroflexota bacterium]